MRAIALTQNDWECIHEKIKDIDASPQITKLFRVGGAFR